MKVLRPCSLSSKLSHINDWKNSFVFSCVFLHVLARNRDGFLVKFRLGLRLMQSPHLSDMPQNELGPFSGFFCKSKKSLIHHDSFLSGTSVCLRLLFVFGTIFYKSRADVSTSPKTGVSVAPQKRLMSSNFFFKKSSILVFIFKRKCSGVKNVTGPISTKVASAAQMAPVVYIGNTVNNQKINKIRSNRVFPKYFHRGFLEPSISCVRKPALYLSAIMTLVTDL